MTHPSPRPSGTVAPVSDADTLPHIFDLFVQGISVEGV